MNRTAFACTLIGLATVSAAETFPVTADAVFTFQGNEIVISRTSVVDPTTITALTQISATCATPCLSPMTVAENVATLGELDVIQFLSSQVETGDGLLVDARNPDQRTVGIIPASVNIPATTVSPENPYRNEIIMALGAEQFEGIFDFSDVMTLVVFDAGPATNDAQTLISDLLGAGYPPDKIAYYRGGMQVWTTLGLTTAEPPQ
ncbi:rhodanese-like domain-containing protein [Octadecabacter sp. 1_MG-2023]|uniref:rhodanese-like domain-containing protein n=1 Tax=unclassified Octadecabacter TaxID=196158 RepID=UPI001C09B9D2|nr:MULTISPECIES: rhodanese-like domain-containing protein [unclassified Octadecabacter]MBU2992517.1 rhodanese-like domain-containing protein [Octadecabacter sp. B2R22]MDO6734726.1 rhodanese-like domain-containing protein [Octadecabacter sp. 1_MG-2023]